MDTTILTTEQQQKLDAHILKCTYKNVALSASTKVGVPKAHTVQELLQLNVDTLRKIGQEVEKATAAHGGSKFNKASRLQLPARSGVYADDWMEFLLIAIELKERQSDAEKKRDEIKDLEAQLEDLKTPDEKRADLKERLAKLNGTMQTT